MTISPAARCARMAGTCWARAAESSSASVSGNVSSTGSTPGAQPASESAIRLGSGLSISARIAPASGVPPGSRVSQTSRPLSRRCSTSRWAWVDLPAPSMPSSVRNIHSYLLMSCLHTLAAIWQLDDLEVAEEDGRLLLHHAAELDGELADFRLSALAPAQGDDPAQGARIGGEEHLRLGGVRQHTPRRFPRHLQPLRPWQLAMLLLHLPRQRRHELLIRRV